MCGGGGGSGVILLSSEPKPGNILDTGRGLFQNHRENGGTEAPL